MVPSALPSRTVFVSRFNRLLAVALWVLVAVLTLSTLLVDPAPVKLLALVPAAFGVLVGWAALWHPSVTVDDDGIEVVNVLRTVTVPWAALVHVDTRFALTLVTPGRKVAAWAAPAPGRAGTAVARRKEQRHGRASTVPSAGDGERRAGDLLATDSGDAAYLVRERWEQLRETGRIPLGAAQQTVVPVQLHVATIVLLVATAIGGWFAVAAL